MHFYRYTFSATLLVSYSGEFLKPPEKSFQYDVLIDRQNICDRKSEIATLNRMVTSKQRVVVYAPRRYGKTSIIRNVIAGDFHKTHRKAVVAYFDLMDVDSLDSLARRLHTGISAGLTESYKSKSLLQAVVSYFKNVSISLSLDPMTQLPTIELRGGVSKPQKTVEELLMGVGRLASARPVFLIFDEFQDIAEIPEAAAILRSSLQRLSNIPIAILGSKRALLSQMFSSNHSPFFSFGDEITLPAISPNDWQPYFNERLGTKGSSISLEVVSNLCELLCHVPNAICEAGFWLCNNLAKTDISREALFQSLDNLVKSKEHSLRYQLSNFSTSERSVIQAIAKEQYVAQVSGKAFLKNVKSGGSGTLKIVEKLTHIGFLEHEQDKGYRMSDPILRYFLLRGDR